MDVTSEEAYTFKRLEPGLYKDLVYISKSAFNIDPGIEYYSKKNQTSVFGPSNLGFVAYSASGEPAAFYGIYSQPMIIDGKEVLAAQSGDTMTHTSHSGKGLFIRLARMTYDLARENNINFVFGFPNGNSYPGFVKKLEWQCPYKLQEFRIKILTLPLSKLAKKIKFLSPIYSLYCSIVFNLFSKKGAGFESSVLENNVGGLNRTSEFITYKLFGGSFLRNIDGVNIWFKTDGFLFIGDIERKEDKDYNLIIGKIKRICFWAGIDIVIFQGTPDTFLVKKMSVFAKDSDAFYMGYLNLSGVYDPMNFKYVFADLDTF